MKTLVAFLFATFLSLTFALAEETKPASSPAKSPLQGDGALQKVRTPLEEIFQFTFQGNRLALDRKMWDAKDKDAAKPAAGQPNVVVPNIQIKPGGVNRIQIQGGFNIQAGGNMFGQGPPIEAIFTKIQAAAGANGHGMSITGDKREINFTGESLSGRLSTGASIRLVLDETQSPQRTLEFNDDGSGGFRVELRHPDGDWLVVQQARSGRFTVLSCSNGPIFAVQGDSFLNCFRENRKQMEAKVLPLLAPLGVNLVMSPELPKIRNSVLNQLMQTPEIQAEWQKLVEDLDGSEFSVREKASEVIGNRFEIYQDKILAKLEDKTIPLEVRSRLQTVVNGHTDQQRIAQTIKALSLMDDAEYLVSLLDLAGTAGVPRVTAQLEKVTNQKLGSDVAAWKDWAAKNGAKTN